MRKRKGLWQRRDSEANGNGGTSKAIRTWAIAEYNREARNIYSITVIVEIIVASILILTSSRYVYFY